MARLGLGSRWRKRIGVAASVVSIGLVSTLGIYDDGGALLAILSPPGSGYDSTSGLLYTAKGGAVTVTRAGTQSCNGGTVAANLPCVEGGALVIPASGQTTTVPTPAGLSRTEGSACMTFAPTWTGGNPSGSTIYFLSGNGAGTVRLGYAIPGGENWVAFDGTNSPAVAAGFTSGVAKRYCTRWSAGQNKLRVENVTAGTSAEAAFSTLPAFDATLGVGATASGSGQVNGAIYGLKLCRTYSGCT